MAGVGNIELDSSTIIGAEFDEFEAFVRMLDGTINAPAKYLGPPAPPAARKRD